MIPNRSEAGKRQQKAAQIAWRLAQYGLTREEYEAMVEAQGGVCAICGRAPNAGKRLSVDHDHRCHQGQTACSACIRGLLCHSCNVMIGLAQDNPDVLIAAASYLKGR